jgi:uncharacterized membrane protein YoaK (UPF0700 family)
MNNNTKRFLLHMAFAVGATVATFVVNNVGLLNLTPTEQGIILAVSTSAASYFRKAGE